MKSLIILLLLPISFFSQKKINQEKFKDLILTESFLIIDVRTPVEFKEGNIKNAVNIDYFSKSFSENISTLDKQKKYFSVLCSWRKKCFSSFRIQEIRIQKSIRLN